MGESIIEKIMDGIRYDYEEAAFLILDHISDEIERLGLIKPLASGTKFYRGRMHDKKTKTELSRLL